MKKVIIILLLIMAGVICEAVDYSFEYSTKLYIGSPIKLSFVLPDTTMNPVFSITDSIGNFQINSTRKYVKNDTLKAEIVFSCYETGKQTLPSYEIRVKDKSFYSEPHEFNINSALVAQDTTLKDIKPLKPIRLQWYDILIPLAGLALIVALIVLLAKYFKKKAKQENMPVIVEDKTPIYDKAMALLMELKRKEYLEKGRFLQYYFELSHVFRYFLEGYYNFNALEMTTNEIQENLKIDSMKIKHDIIDLLKEMDKIKFADYKPEVHQAQSATEFVESYILEIKRVESTVSKSGEESK